MAWQSTEVVSPHIEHAVPVIAVKGIPSVVSANRMQSLNIYLLKTVETEQYIGRPIEYLPRKLNASSLPQWLVHIHGGAWRDPQLAASSIEAAVAHAFSNTHPDHPITAIVSINYTLSPFPTHPTLPYDPAKHNHEDPAREAIHPKHVQDVLECFSFLRTIGLKEGSYILSGHSAGACLAFQAVLQSPKFWGFRDPTDIPQPAALLGMNGLYDLPDLVHNLGSSHQHLQDVYEDLLQIAFGPDQAVWKSASPARVEPGMLLTRTQNGAIPKLIVLDQSTADQLVPVNQTEKLEILLKAVPGLNAVRGHRCTGRHAAPWEEGFMIWENLLDILGLLRDSQ